MMIECLAQLQECGNMANLFFPIDSSLVAWKSKISQGWDVSEEKAASGRRRTLCQQKLPGWTIEVNFPELTHEEQAALLGFYARCKGSWNSFLYKDYTYCEVKGQQLGKGADGDYQCIIPFDGYVEPAEYVDNLVVYVDGKKITNYTVANGKIKLTTNGVVTADYEYYWRVCFDKKLSITNVFMDVYSASLSLRVVRE